MTTAAANPSTLVAVVAAMLLIAYVSGAAGQQQQQHKSEAAQAQQSLDGQDSMDPDPYTSGYYAPNPQLDVDLDTAAFVSAHDLEHARFGQPNSNLIGGNQRPQLTRAQLQRLLQRIIYVQSTAADALAQLLPQLPSNSLAPYAGPNGAGPMALSGSGSGSGSSSKGFARMLRMPPLPEMKRIARGRAMQCYFNPISCY